MNDHNGEAARAESSGFQAVRCHSGAAEGAKHGSRRALLRTTICGAAALAACALAATSRGGGRTMLEPVPHGPPNFEHEGWPLRSIQDEDGELGRKLRGPFPRIGIYGRVPQSDANIVDDREDPQATEGIMPSCVEDPISVWCTGGFGGGQKAIVGPGDARVLGRRDNALGEEPEMSGPVHTPKDLGQAFTYMYGSPVEGDRNSRVWKEPLISSWQYDLGSKGDGQYLKSGHNLPTWRDVPSWRRDRDVSYSSPVEQQVLAGRNPHAGGAAAGGAEAGGNGLKAGSAGGGVGGVGSGSEGVGDERRERQMELGELAKTEEGVDKLRMVIARLEGKVAMLQEGGGGGGSRP